MEVAGQVQRDLHRGWLGPPLPGSSREAAQLAALTRMGAQHVRAALATGERQERLVRPPALRGQG